MSWHILLPEKAKMPITLQTAKSATVPIPSSLNIEQIKKVVNKNADAQRVSLNAVYHSSLATSAVTILISIVALLAAVVAVVKLVIRPLRKTNKEIKEIITGIDNREGDLTRRVTITVNQEVASVGTGINAFMGKLQKIFRMISSNASELEGVVNEVRESVQTSNESVSDLSALTEELSATMQDISDNASRINENTESVAGRYRKSHRRRARSISIPKK